MHGKALSLAENRGAFENEACCVVVCLGACKAFSSLSSQDCNADNFLLLKPKVALFQAQVWLSWVERLQTL